MKKIKKIVILPICLIISLLFQAKSISLLANSNDISLQEALNCSNENLAQTEEISNNLRDPYDNGMKYENKTYKMTYTGSWLRSITLVNNEILNCEKLYLNENLINTSSLNLYYGAKIKYTQTYEHKTVGIVIGKTKLENTLEEVYVSINIAPYNKSLVVYFFKQIGGLEDVSYEIPISFDFNPNQDYLLEILKDNTDFNIYINQTKVYEFSQYSITTSANTYNIDLMSLIPAVGVNFMDIDAELSNLTCKYLNDGTYKPYNVDSLTIQQARNFENENIFLLDDINISKNKRDPEDNGMTFEKNISSCEYTGSYLRATHIFTNKYLDCEELLIDNENVSTKDLNVYYKTVFNISNKESDRILGIVIGKTKVMNQNVYISVNLCPANNYISLYFSTNKPYDFSYNIPSNFMIDLNKDYTLEVLKYNGHLKVYIDGKQYLDISEYEATALFASDVKTNIKINDLIPCFGTNYMDINATMKDFEMKYLSKYSKLNVFEEPKYPHTDKEYIFNTEQIVPENNAQNSIFKIKVTSIILYIGGGILILLSLILLIGKRGKKHE